MMQVSMDTSGPMNTRIRAMRVAAEPECPLFGHGSFEGAGGSPFAKDTDPSEEDDAIPDAPTVAEGAPTFEECYRTTSKEKTTVKGREPEVSEA